MKISNYLKYLLFEENDYFDNEHFNDNSRITEQKIKDIDTEITGLKRDKAPVSDFNTHKTAAVLDHPDRSVTDAKIGSRTIGGTSGVLQSLFTAIGNMFKSVTGESAWNTAPKATLSECKTHIDNDVNPHKTTKAQVGLGCADNTPDTDKPVSKAQAAAVKAVQGDVNANETANNAAHAAMQTEISANTAERHSHSNKAVLDGVTAALISAWNGAVTHIADAVKHITPSERSLWNTVSQKLGLSGGTMTGFLTLHAKPTSALHAATKSYVDDNISAVGGGDMSKAVYDTNNNGIVDNAEKVNGLTVLTAVPAGAKFTDTVYTHPASHPASIILQDSLNRFVSDTEKSTWNGKASSSHTHAKENITNFPTSMPANGGTADTAKSFDGGTF